jgi:hypothetical protein
MKRLRIVRITVVGLLLAGAVVLVGCSRYSTAHDNRGKGRGAEAASRRLEQGDPGGNRKQDRPLEERGQVGRRQDGRVLKKGSALPEQSGKSVVDSGAIEELAGTLVRDGSEWHLDSGTEMYILHLGNPAYVRSTGIELHEGEPLEVRGFVSGEEIAVVAVWMDGRVYTFRNEDGRPMWAGNGRRENPS